MPPRLPSLNPIIVNDAHCDTCGRKMEIEIDTFGPKKRVQGIWHICKNAETGCSYRVYSNARLAGQAQPIPAEKKD